MRKKTIINLSLFFFFLVSFQSSDVIIEEELNINKLLQEKDLNKIIDAIVIYKENEEWNKVVACYNEAFRLSEAEEANNYLTKAFLVANQYLPNTALEKAAIFQRLGEYYAYTDLDSSLHYSKIALRLFEQHEEWEDKAWINYRIGEAYYYKELYDSMEIHLFETERLVKTHQLDKEILDYVYTLLGAYYYVNKADLEKAIESSNESLNIALQKENKTLNDSINLSSLYNNLGVFYEEKKNLTRALQYYQLALDLLESINSESDLKLTLENYGRVQFSLGNTNTAIQYLKKGLFINDNAPESKEKNQYQKEVYSRLGKIYKELGQLDSANYFINQSIAIAQQNEINHKTESILSAMLDVKAQRYDVALQKLNAIPLKSNDFSTRGIYHKYLILNALAKIYTQQKDYQTALQYYQKAFAGNCPNFKDTLDVYALPTDVNPFFMNYLVETLKNKAITLKTINTPKSLKAAFETNQLAITYAEQMRRDFAFEETKIKLNEQSTALYEAAIEIAYQLYESTNDQIYLEEAFIIAEKQKGILLLESLIDEKGKQHYQVPEQLIDRERQLKTDISFYKQKRLEAQQKQDTAKYEIYQDYYTNFNIEFGNLKDTLHTYYKSYFDLEYQNSIATVAVIQKDLVRPQQAFVQYIAIDSLFYVFVIEKEKQQLITLPKGTKENQILQELQALLHYPKSIKSAEQNNFEQYSRLAYQGYQQVFEPLKDYLSSDVTELIIVPDNSLNYLPFEALLNETVSTTTIDYLDLPYLLKRYQFHYGYSGTLLLENQRQYNELTANDDVLAFAPPYEITAPIAERGGLADLRSEVRQLKGTAKEIKAISTHFDGTFDFSKSATKENFKTQASDYGILHLAMHGKPSLEDPNDAYLIFSNVENNDDNLLYHYEITALETDAQLAVLSACETGVGKELEGEGVMSLGRGFMYAGIPSVVMSFWKMNDQSTSELMPLFYENLGAGMRKDKALHQAKLTYLENAIPERANPFYWAGFVSFGDAQPIKRSASYAWIWWIGGVLGILMLALGFQRVKVGDMIVY